MNQIILLAALAASAAHAADRLPAFPGAEGAGKWTRGGRGGKVIAVVNLNDSGPGSLRAAVAENGPRTAVFRVSGTIELQKPLRVQHPFITIAGQTAPGDGICLKGSELQIGTTQQVIVRHLRCRTGDKTSKASELDAITIWDAKDVVVDHCSATWSTDECLSVTNDSDRVTVQNCLMAEALTEHSYGSIIASRSGKISFLSNLYACNRSRNPRPASYPGHEGPDPLIDFRHNVIFNWQSAAGYSAAERVWMNYIGNCLKPGLDTSPADRGTAYYIYEGGIVEMFISGCQIESQPPGKPQGGLISKRAGSTLKLREAPFEIEAPVKVMSAAAAFEFALKNAGAVKPKRDAADERIIAGVRDGSGRQRLTIGDDAWPELKSTPPPPDTDHDGLPDAWEKAQGMNASDPADAAMPSKEGWTHLELWMNSL